MTTASSRSAVGARALLATLGLCFAAMLGCGGSGNNQVCATDLDCQSSFVCVADPALPHARCMRPCEEGTRLCDDGSVCVALAGGRACYPGGDVAFGETCVASLDCEAGTVCPASVGSCVQACDEIARVCLLTERCATGDVVGPFCSPD